MNVKSSKYPTFKEAYHKFKRNINLLPKEDQGLIKKAYLIAKKEHKNQKKFGLYPFIVHPLAIFNFIFQELKIKNRDLLIAALIHDTVEDGNNTLNNIKKNFGEKVYRIVKTVTRISSPKENEKERGLLKMKHFKNVVCKGSREAKILGIADKYDNIKNTLLIPPSSIHYKKFDRWLKETKAFIRLAKTTDKKAFKLLENEYNKIKSLI